mgnify:CR=1 FL=1
MLKLVTRLIGAVNDSVNEMIESFTNGEGVATKCPRTNGPRKLQTDISQEPYKLEC